MKRVKVLIADNHCDIRKVVREFLDRLPNVEVVGEAVDGVDVVNKVEELHPDVVLMELDLPKRSGFEATRIIKQHWPSTKVILEPMADDIFTREKIQSVKADGQIVKSSLKQGLEEMFNDDYGSGGRVRK